MTIKHTQKKQRPINWRVNPFCDAHGIGRTKFYELVAAEKIKTIKCGKTTLITDTEARRFQDDLEAGRI